MKASEITMTRQYGRRNARGRLVTVWRASFGEMAEEGLTQADARASLIERIDALASGTFEPAIIAHASYCAIVTRTRDAWSYRIVTPAGARPCSVTCDGRDETIAAARRHLAQWLDGDGIDGMPVLDNDDDRADTRRYRAWQAAFTHAPANAPDTHQWASDHASEFLASHGDLPYGTPGIPSVA